MPTAREGDDMMFDPSNGAADRQRKAILIAAMMFWLVCFSTIVFVASHFITKYW